jgi:glycosyltransferase involved in cell wall biosynthesis
MKIAQVNKYYFLRGGTERYMFGLSSMLEDEGHKIVPFSMKDPKNVPTTWSKHFVSAVNAEKVTVGWEGLRTAGRFIYSFEARRNFAKMMKQAKPDLVHIHNIYHHISPSILPVATAMGVPVVMTAHDYALVAPNYSLYHNGLCAHTKPNRYWQAVTHKCVKNSRIAGVLEAVEMTIHEKLGLYMNNVARIIAPTNFVASKLVEYGVPEEKLVVVPHPFLGVGEKGKKRKVAESEEGNYMLYVGRLVEEKGVDVLIRAAAKVPEIPVRIVGSGPEEHELRVLAEELGARNVTFVGFKDGAALAAEYAGARAVIVPSVWYEVFGLISLEAYAAGKPVIASRIGGLPEVVHDRETGLLFLAGSSEELAKKIVDLWEDAERAMKMGEAGRELLATEYSPKLHYERIMGVYAGVK